MFVKRIYQSLAKFSLNMYDGFFGNVHTRTFNDDYGFDSVMRGIVSRRVPDGQYCKVNHSNVRTISMYDYDEYARRMVERLDFNVRNSVCIYSIPVDADTADRLKTDITNSPHLNGFEFVPDMTDFVSTTHKSAFYYNKELQSTIVIIFGPLTFKVYHLLASLVTRYFPNFFSNDPINPLELAVLSSLTKRISSMYEEAIVKLFDSMNIKDLLLDKCLRGFENKVRSSQVEKLKDSLDREYDKAQSILNQYSNIMNQVNELNIRIAGLECKLGDNDECELLDFFKNTKSVRFVDMEESRGTICFNVLSTIENFDPEMYETMRDRAGSHIWNHTHDNADAKLLLDSIFSEGKIKVRVIAQYNINVIHGDVSCVSHMNYDQYTNSHIPNPHIQYHACLGNYGRYIREALMSGDNIRAITQCIASAVSVNIGEGITFGPFVDQIISSNNKIFELPDGRNVASDEAIAYLKEAMNNGETD